MRLEHGRDASPYGQTSGEAGLRAVRVHDVGADAPGQFGDPPDLGRQSDPGVAGRVPDLGLGAQRGHVRRERPMAGAGHDDPHSGGDLGADEIGDDAAHPSVDRLDEMQHGEAGTGSVP